MGTVEKGSRESAGRLLRLKPRKVVGGRGGKETSEDRQDEPNPSSSGESASKRTLYNESVDLGLPQADLTLSYELIEFNSVFRALSKFLVCCVLRESGVFDFQSTRVTAQNPLRWRKL